MKKNRLIYLSLLSLISFVVLQSNSGGYTGMEVASGASSGPGCSGSGCHSAQTLDPNLLIQAYDSGNNPTTSYAPGQKYTIKISLSKTNVPSNMRAGFQSIIKTALGVATTGSYSNFGTAVTMSPISGVPVVRHSQSNVSAIQDLSGVVTWEYDWTAPAFGEGNVEIYAICNDANGDNNNTLDFIKYGSSSLFMISAGLNDLDKEIKAIYPNPTSGLVKIDMEKSTPSKVSLYSISGQLMLSKSFKDNQLSLDISNLSTGNYFIAIEQGGLTVKRQITKL